MSELEPEQRRAVAVQEPPAAAERDQKRQRPDSDAPEAARLLLPVQLSAAPAPQLRAVDVPWPSPQWRKEIEELSQGKGLLADGNGEYKNMKKLEGMPALAARLTASLLADEPAANARDLLMQMRALAVTGAPLPAHVAGPGVLGPSKFSKIIYTGLLEVINAKLLWQKGDHQLHAWPTDGHAKKPDFLVSDTLPADGGGDAYEQAATVGDHAKVTGELDPAKVAKSFADEVQDKLSTYPGKRVRVVVDLVDNKAVNRQATESAEVFDLKLTALKAEFALRLKEIHLGKDRLLQVDAVLPGGVVVTYLPRDWS